MARLEELKEGSSVSGIQANGPVQIVNVEWMGTEAANIFYQDAHGAPGTVLLFRDAEHNLKIEQDGRVWSFDAPGELLRLVSEAQRIRLAYLFDPLLAIHGSDVDPLPHQITAVYDEMLRRQPLRFLLADDPGAGKTIMTGLFIKELKLRGDLLRCLIVAPGNLAEQWQEELAQKFDLRFDIYSNAGAEAAFSNWFLEHDLVICRLDQLSRNPDLQELLAETDWDLVVVDEAHKMSATFDGEDVKRTGRYELGMKLSHLARHFLLLSATPHNGKDVDFQLFLALLDNDRFEGKPRQGAHTANTSDLMRRMIKEHLVKMDGTPLFPERWAYTVSYELSDPEKMLYHDVTRYVREQFGKSEALQQDGRARTVGFALTVLQRRLASSPEAIYQSLKRRRERLESRLREATVLRQGALLSNDLEYSKDSIEDIDDGSVENVEEAEEELIDLATAANTIQELADEVETLKELEVLADEVRRSGQDRKWEELSSILNDRLQEVEPDQTRRKLVVFTEQRDTLNYLEGRIKSLIGRPEAVVTITGGMGREERRNAQARFTHDKSVEVLLATDAAGEGINLQRAHLMVNYDLPWNPNRLEQRFGRIHRIGQTEVCHLWNLVSTDTREGDVYNTLLRKLEEERKALDGRVFDVLGKLSFGKDRSLRELMIDAVRYGDDDTTRAKLHEVVENALDRDHLRSLMESNALYQTELSSSTVRDIAEQMARADARRLQPHFISAFFIEAFRFLGGTVYERERDRYEITRVPFAIRQHDRLNGIRAAIQEKYQRITFERGLKHIDGRPPAEFVSAGHPLLDATIAVLLEKHESVLRRGGVLIDPADSSEDIRALFYLDHSVYDGVLNAHGQKRTISRQLQFVEIDGDGHVSDAGPAPYLDYRPISDDERALVDGELAATWLTDDLATKVEQYAVREIVPRHYTDVRDRKQALIKKTSDAVHERLMAEITRLDGLAVSLRIREEAGKTPKLNSLQAERRADDLRERYQRRMAELDLEMQISTQAPRITGGLLIVPQGLLNRLVTGETEVPDTFARETERIERIAMDLVMMREQAIGNEPKDVSAERRGYDVESRVGGEFGRLRFIEVKGRVKGAPTVTVTKNEILTALNKPEDFIFALVEVDGDLGELTYLTEPFASEPDFAAASVNYEIKKLFAQARTID